MCIKAVATDDEGQSVCINTEGVVAMNEITMALAFGAPDAKPSPFGFGGENAHTPSSTLAFPLAAAWSLMRSTYF